jgi:DNA (cytosine-5)-methyltransferase 1
LFVIVDFTGQRAGEILFESAGLSGYFAARGGEGERTAADAESGAGSAVTIINDQGGDSLSIEKDGISPTLRSQTHGNLPIVCGAASAYGETGRGYWQDGVQTLRAEAANRPSNPGNVLVGAFMAGQAKNARSIAYNESVSPTLKGSPSGLNQVPCICEPQLARTLTARGDPSPCADRGQNVVAIHQNQQGEVRTSDLAYTLGTNANATGRNAPLIAFSQNQRNEVRGLNDIADCFATKPGVNQQPYVMRQETNCLTPWDTQQARIHTPDGKSPALAGADGGGGRNPAGLVLCAATTQANAEILSELCPTITEAAGKSGDNKPYIVHPPVAGTLCASGAGSSRPAGNANETDLCVAYCLQGNMIGRKEENGPQGNGVNMEVSFTLSAADRHCVAAAIPINTQIATRHKALGEGTGFGKDGDPAFTLQAAHSHAVAAVDCRNLNEGDVSGTLQSKCTGGYSLNYQNPVRLGYIVRRLTPTECERLMSLPDGWTEYGHNKKPMSDSARYQMCGNSIVVNCLAYIMQNIAELLKNEQEAKVNA